MNDDERFVLKVEYSREGETTMEGTMTTGSLRSARNEFRARLTDALGIRIRRDHMKAIVEAGDVAVVGPIAPDADRFTMTLTDSLYPALNPPKFIFESSGNSWLMRRILPGE